MGTPNGSSAGVSTASIETLTAAVKVLMVGSRQVTLSVVRQLDGVDFEDIEPFGRVRPWESSTRIWVIGRRRVTGELVLSHVDRHLAGKTAERNLQQARALPLIVLAGLR